MLLSIAWTFDSDGRNVHFHQSLTMERMEGCDEAGVKDTDTRRSNLHEYT